MSKEADANCKVNSSHCASNDIRDSFSRIFYQFTRVFWDGNKGFPAAEILSADLVSLSFNFLLC